MNPLARLWENGYGDGSARDTWLLRLDPVLWEALLCTLWGHLVVALWLKPLSGWVFAKRLPSDPRPEFPLEWRLHQAMARTARVIPSSRPCLAQAIAAKLMLARRGYRATIHLGVGRNDDASMRGHAWLEAGGLIITGRAGIHAVTPLPR